MKKIIATGALAGAAVLSLAACGASTAKVASTTSARPAVSAATPTEAATSEANCTVDCTDPVASGINAWYAQVQAPLQEVTQDLQQIASDAGSPDALTADGAQLAGDAQAVLNEENDPSPVDNSDFVSAMNDYIAAGNDYSGDNSSGQQNITQAKQEIEEGDTALTSFQSAISASSSAASPAATAATTAPGSSAPATTPTATFTGSCSSQMNQWYVQDGGKTQITDFHESWTNLRAATFVALLHADAQAVQAAATSEEQSGPPACDATAAHAWATAMTDLGKAATLEKTSTTTAPIAAADSDASAAFTALATVTAEGNKYAQS